MFDLAVDRERRRETQGYVTPAQARAFLHSARQFQLADSTAPPHSPIARAYFRAIEWTPPSDAIANRGSMSLPPVGSPPDETSDAIAAVMDVLLEAGVLPQQPRALLGGSQEHARYPALLQAHVQFARDAGGGVYSMRAEDLAFRANAILASQGAENRLCAAGVDREGGPVPLSIRSIRISARPADRQARL